MLKYICMLFSDITCLKYFRNTSCDINLISIFFIKGNLDIFLWISLGDIANTNKLTLILKFIGQCDVKHIMMKPIKTIPSVLKVSTDIITSIADHPNGLDEILVIMFVLIFKTDVILYIYIFSIN